MPPDATAVAASHDIVQILFYFVCILASGGAAVVVWLAKYMLIPARDRHFQFMDRLEASEGTKSQMHRDNLKTLGDIYRDTQEIKDHTKEIKSKIRCPRPENPGPLHA